MPQPHYIVISDFKNPQVTEQTVCMRHDIHHNYLQRCDWLCAPS